MPFFRRRPARRAVLVLALTLALAGCSGAREELPQPGSEAYAEAVSSFYAGLTALQAGEGLGADEKLEHVTEVAAGEPAAWANLGVIALRAGDLDAAAERLARAETLAPDNADIQLLLGRLAAQKGDAEAARTRLRKAVQLAPENARAAYALTEELERSGGAAAEVQQIFERLLEQHPENLAVILDLARVAGARGDAAAMQAAVMRAAPAADAWPEEVRAQYAALQSSLQSGAAQAATQLAFLRNMLVRLPEFRHDQLAVRMPAEEGAELIPRFIRLPQPSSTPSPRDSALAFTPQPVQAPGGPWTRAQSLILSPEAEPTVALIGPAGLQLKPDLRLPLPDAPGAPPSVVVGVDLNTDFLTDLVAAGPRGLRIYQQGPNTTFTDITAASALPPAILGGAYTGLWAADLDLEGDMDLLLARGAGPPLMLRNNNDRTFTPAPIFAEARRPVSFVWADFDADGDPDAALLEASGALRLYSNRRGGVFTLQELPAASVAAIAAADLDADARFELLALGAGGALEAWRTGAEGRPWQSAAVAAAPAGASFAPGAALLAVADFDNNGGLDALASGADQTLLWLMTPQRRLVSLDASLPPVSGIADLNADGKLDLLGIGASGAPVQHLNASQAGYQWKTFRTRAATVSGDQRINAFGIGGEVEVRSGLLFQKQLIQEPYVHFGLGDHKNADVARIIWPNGSVQAEFNLDLNEPTLASQRLKGSCPWLFTNNGEEMVFVTDAIWRSPLGLRINAQETAGIMATEDWVKVRGDQLRPVGGRYDLRITADLWETHFFDHVALMVVDHPEGTEVFVDERFAFPPPELKVHAFSAPRPIAEARDDRGRLVTDLLAARDQQYLGDFPRGRFQGIAEDHYVEIDLGEDAPASGPLTLLAFGWLRPTDSSINVAISHGRHDGPRSLSVEAPDGKGGWRTVRQNLGSPTGKLKTMLIDLTDVFPEGAPRRVRLRTTMEIYWDHIEWAVPAPSAPLRTQKLLADRAELRYRGFSRVATADRNAPELPIYAELNGRSQFWRDLEGYYTRFGDVRPLLTEIDDRYVIMNAGDELVFSFQAPAEPPKGWRRDYVFIGDGWVKDGDYNTTFSKTVLPLPAHNRDTYQRAPTRLEDDPVYREHAADWREFHTRYVGTERFQTALLPPQ